MVLGACDSGGLAVETRERAAAEPVASATAAYNEAAEAAPEAEPPVTVNRRETADAKVQRLYERNGAAFGAKSADEYLQKVRAPTFGRRRSSPANSQAASKVRGAPQNRATRSDCGPGLPVVRKSRRAESPSSYSG